jgi:hypothetical protein
MFAATTIARDWPGPTYYKQSHPKWRFRVRLPCGYCVKTRRGSDGIINSSCAFDRVATARLSDKAMHADTALDRHSNSAYKPLARPTICGFEPRRVGVDPINGRSN